MINNLLYINSQLQTKKSLKGMDKLAGYTELKSNLRELFVNPIQKLNAGINATVPNMILLYGPKGCGKSMMANAIQEETSCNVINIDISLNCKSNKKNGMISLRIIQQQEIKEIILIYLTIHKIIQKTMLDEHLKT